MYPQGLLLAALCLTLSLGCHSPAEPAGGSTVPVVVFTTAPTGDTLSARA